MKDAHEGRSMTMQFNEGLTVREFGDALLSIAELRAWLTRTRREIETVPPLPESGFVQVEALFCGIELAAQADYPTEDALGIVARNRVLSNHDMAALAPQWLIGAQRHAVWRSEIRAAIERGELTLHDPVTKLPIALSQPVGAGQTGDDGLPGDSNKPLQRHRHQENEILRVIRQLGYDPQKLPKPKPGKAGVKSAVRPQLGFTETVFDKAWERLRNAGLIANA
jgi:hypothetical protein